MQGYEWLHKRFPFYAFFSCQIHSMLENPCLFMLGWSYSHIYPLGILRLNRLPVLILLAGGFYNIPPTYATITV